MTGKSWMRMSAAELAASIEAEQAMRRSDQHAKEVAGLRAVIDALQIAIANQATLMPTPQIMLAHKESFEAGRLHGAREEREACAKVCEAQRNIDFEAKPFAVIESDPVNLMAERCAAAIRERGAP